MTPPTRRDVDPADTTTEPDPSIRPILVTLALIVFVVAVGSLVTRTSKVEPLAPQPVVYTVDGSAASASLMLRTPTGSLQFDASLPLTDEFGKTGLLFDFTPGSQVSLVATADGEGTVTCHISVDGSEITKMTGAGRGQSAVCRGTV